MLKNLAFVAGVALATLTPLVANAADKIRLSYSTGSVAYMPYMVADSMGFLKDAGIETEIVKLGDGAKTLAAVVGGSADVTIITPSSVYLAIDKGLPLEIFAALTQQYSSCVVFSKEWAASHNITEDSRLEQKLAALKGMRVAVTGPGGTDQLVRYFAYKGGVDADREMTITGVGSDPAAMLGSLENGRIDGFVTSAPTTIIAKQKFGAVIAFDTAGGKIPDFDGYPHMTAVSSPEWLKDNPETAAKFVKAIQMALDAIHDPARTNQVRDAVRASHYASTDPVIFEEVWKNVIKGASDTVKIDPEKLKMVITLQKIQSPELSDKLIEGSYTNEFTEKATQ